ncbi:MAG TPA: transglutaminase-like domain-containing protein [Bryobacteraceae bacterium]|nr:transglutaminase-like domain-containing protein [Bryobacteraceae bacterium]
MLAAILPFTLVAPAQQTENYGVNITSSQNVDSNGNSQVRWVMNFNPPRGYDRVKRNYPNLYVLFRDFGPERASFEINRDTLKITSDDSQRSISFVADVWGLAVSRNHRWQIEMAPNEQVSTQDGNRVFTVLQYATSNGLAMSIINTYVLPASAGGVQVDKENRLLTYTLPVSKPAAGAGDPAVDVSVRYKKRLMSALYKIYGDQDAQSGSYWVAKTMVKNVGKAPLYDLKIYYRLGEYSDMSVPDAYSVVPPGGIVVDRYYPVIASRVAQLRTPTPVQLYIRYEYKDANGRAFSSELTRRPEMLGINQFEFSNLNDEDRSDSWFDYFNNAPLLAAFVTRMDDVVKQFAGYVSEKSGGAAANASNKDATRWLAAAYELERSNHIVYQTPSGFLTQDHSSGQDIKFPRDVFRDKSGTCVDLAITYAALAEAVGLPATLVVVPGHTFAAIKLPEGGYLPVENTGLAGGNQSIPFEKAVEIGNQELQKYLSDGLYYLVNVSEQWSAGRVPNPEMQPLSSDFLAQSGIQRSPGAPSSAPANGSRKNSSGGRLAGQAEMSQAPAPVGKQFKVVHSHGLNNLVTYCMGTLTITADSVIYTAAMANDGRADQFQFRKSDIGEAKKNRFPLNQNGIAFPAFHIRLQNGANFNFAVLDDYNRGQDPSAVLVELVQ